MLDLNWLGRLPQESLCIAEQPISILSSQFFEIFHIDVIFSVNLLV